MEYKNLGRSGLKVSRLCLGTGGHRLDAGDEAAFPDDQFVVDGDVQGQYHGVSLSEAGTGRVDGP